MDRAFLNEAAQAIHAKLPDNWGFILLAAPPTGTVPETQQRLVYVSNLQRPDAINVLKEWLIKASGPEDWMQHIK